MSVTEAMTVYELPFAARFNPLTAGLSEQMSRWGVAPEARFDRLVARMYPVAPGRLLGLIGQFIAWLFLYDDRLDPGGPEDARDDLVRSTERVLAAGGPIGSDDPVVRCLADWCARIEPEVTASWWRNCAADLAGVVSSLARESRARDDPDLDSYLDDRLNTSGWTVLTDLAELGGDAVLPPGVRGLPAVRRLRRTTGDIACAINDLLSLGKEIDAGERHNQVLIVQRRDGCSRREAIGRTERWAARRLQDYLDLRAEVRSGCPAGRRSLLDRYIRALEDLMRGSLDWSLETSRYRLAGTASTA